MKLSHSAISLVVLGSVVFAPISSALAQEAITQGTARLTFTTLTKAGFPEQDVFIGGPTAANPNTLNEQVVRVFGPDTKNPVNLVKTIFRSEQPVTHDLTRTGTTPLGPFARGKTLDTALQAWLNAKGSASYTILGGGSSLNAAFENLMPNALYSLWCDRYATGASDFVASPCLRGDGSMITFTTDPGGTATLSVSFPTVAPTGKSTKSVFALVYHSDGKTNGSTPGSYGVNAHTHLIAFLPTKSENIEQQKADDAIAQATCVANISEVRDLAILETFQKYHEVLEGALLARSKALKAAWSITTNTAERKTAVKAAASAFNDTVRKSWKDLSEKRNGAWKTFRIEQKKCNAIEKYDSDFINEAFDAKL